jgi:alkylated DNA nucleotide flippase Atl1
VTPAAAGPEAAGPEGVGAADDFASRVVAVVETIPPGRVMTYGSVAAAVGSRSSRGVGQVMAWAGSDLPWWRVVRASGLPPEGHEQRALEQYRVEGTPLRQGRTGVLRVDLERAAWSP